GEAGRQVLRTRWPRSRGRWVVEACLRFSTALSSAPRAATTRVAANCVLGTLPPASAAVLTATSTASTESESKHREQASLTDKAPPQSTMRFRKHLLLPLGRG